MKKILLTISVLLSFILSSCFKDYDQEYFQYRKQTVEFDAAVPLSKVSGKYYPLLNLITELNGKQVYRVNLFGVQSTKDEIIKFRIDANESTAVEGRDYRFFGANDHITIPANASFGYVEVEVLASIEGEKMLVLELVGNDNIAVATNYRGIAIPMTAFGAKIADSKKVAYPDFLHVTEVRLGNHTSTNKPQFLDMRNALTYYWVGAQLVDASTINFAYMHSPKSSTNQASLVPPGFSAMSSTWGVAIYNKLLSWQGTKLTSVFHKVNASNTALATKYNNISSNADIQDLYQAIAVAPSRTTGEQIIGVTTGDLIGYYCPELSYYAVIKISNGLSWGQFESAGINQDTGFYMDFEYKVQK